MASARALTLAAYASFVPIGIATVLLGPLLPILSARWSLNYAQAGVFFPIQYVASTVAVAFSGVLVSRMGFRFAMRTGLLLTALGLALVMAGPKWLAMICIAAYGGGVGLAVPAANLMVAEVNPGRRSATLNSLNFCWSAGAVACPFLVAAAAKAHHVPLFLAVISASSLIAALTFVFMQNVDGVARENTTTHLVHEIRNRRSLFLILAATFFLYVGVENGFGFWVASFAKSLGDLSASVALMTPAFFYAALTLGRLLAPLLLRSANEIKLVRAGLLIACAGMAGMIFSRGLAGVVASACAAGFGLSYVYPIAISFLARDFGSASSGIGSVMFVLSNVGGGLFPWIVGVASNGFGTLKAGLFVPLVGAALMYVLFVQDWNSSHATGLNRGLGES